jgi:hypothetical protein
VLAEPTSNGLPIAPSVCRPFSAIFSYEDASSVCKLALVNSFGKTGQAEGRELGNHAKDIEKMESTIGCDLTCCKD